MTKRVLVVDDVAEIRTLIRRVLDADEYQVNVASTLAEARTMDPAGYDVVVVDSHLGTDSGIDLIDELGSADPAAACRCLVITGDPADVSSGLAYLAKPFRAPDLLDAVRALSHPAVSTPGSGPPGSGPPVWAARVWAAWVWAAWVWAAWVWATRVRVVRARAAGAGTRGRPGTGSTPGNTAGQSAGHAGPDQEPAGGHPPAAHPGTP